MTTTETGSQHDERLDALRDQLNMVMRPAQDLIERAESQKRKLSHVEQGKISDCLDAAKPIEDQIREIKAAKADEIAKEQVRKFTHFEPDSPDSGGSSGFKSGAPSLFFSDKQIDELHKAALNRHTKATITTGNAPQSEVGQFKLPPWPFLRDTTRILDLIPTLPTGAPTVNTFRGLVAASAAAPVAQGANKPESTPTWEQVSFPVRKIAHFTRINDEVIADYSEFKNVVGGEMLAGLVEAENDQLLNGTGVAPNLLGLLNVTGIQTHALGVDSRIDAMHKAITLLRTGTAFTEPDTIILNPADWQDIRLEKDANGNYLLGPPNSEDVQRLWGVRVVATTKIVAGTGLVANLKFARVYVREAAKLEVAPLGGGSAEFIANQTLVRAEERLAGVAVHRPTAIVKVTGL